jgi:Holliday junction resolvase RusA-like endonuclease
MTDTLFTETPVPVGPSAPIGTGIGDRPVPREAATSRPILEIHVVGIPAPQGSKNAFNNPHTGRAQMIESSSKKLKPWRQDVKQAALDALDAHPGYTAPPAGVGVALDITFLMSRPAGHYRTGRNAHLLRDSAPVRPTTRPDVDKLLRSTLDALKVAGVYLDDSHVVTVTGRKVYAREHTGAVIYVYTGEST